MKNYLSYETLEAIKTHQEYHQCLPGVQYNISHLNCPAGPDVKKRLYVKVTEDGSSIVAFCHHCRGRGFIRLRTKLPTVPMTSDGLEVIDEPGSHFKARVSWGMHLKNYQDSIPFPEYFDGEDEFDTFPLIHFRPGKDINHARLVANGAYGMGVYNGVLYIPKYYGDAIYAFNIRAVGTDPAATRKDAPKWRKIFNEPFKKEMGNAIRISIYDTNETRPNTCVLCEDDISAMMIDLAGFAGVSLGGVYVDSVDLLRLSQVYDNVVVWIDNDSEIVRDQAENLLSTCKIYFNQCGFITRLADPKQFGGTFIKDTVQQALAMGRI